MDRSDALEELAEKVVFGKVTIEDLKHLNLTLKEGKTFADVLGAQHLRQGQRPGDFERMLAHVQNNLKEIII